MIHNKNQTPLLGVILFLLLGLWHHPAKAIELKQEKVAYVTRLSHSYGERGLFAEAQQLLDADTLALGAACFVVR